MSGTARLLPERCPSCGRFCHVVYRWAGAHYGETTSCPNPDCDYPDRRENVTKGEEGSS